MEEKTRIALRWSEAIRSIMKWQGWSMNDLATKVGLTRAAINFWVNGRKRDGGTQYYDPSVSMASTVAGVAHIRPEDFVIALLGKEALGVATWERLSRVWMDELIEALKSPYEEEEARIAEEELVRILRNSK